MSLVPAQVGFMQESGDWAIHVTGVALYAPADGHEWSSAARRGGDGAGDDAAGFRIAHPCVHGPLSEPQFGSLLAFSTKDGPGDAPALAYSGCRDSPVRRFMIEQRDCELSSVPLARMGHIGLNSIQAVDVSEAEVATHGVHHRVHGGAHPPTVTQGADVHLDVGALDPDRRIQPIGLAPGEPRPQP